MKKHSNWLDFDVKILKKGFKRGWERFKTNFPWKAISGHFALGESRKFLRVARWVAKASRWTCDLHCMTCKSQDES